MLLGIVLLSSKLYMTIEDNQSHCTNKVILDLGKDVKMRYYAFDYSKSYDRQEDGSYVCPKLENPVKEYNTRRPVQINWN